ncbi:serine hydrolase [Anaerovorax odorimutans]|uniref:Serine hydrolase n=1 Tax=Anaerovorax odorimutans TaxID=109327 RepID=A0ABT1RR04_9FIRM|nr:serine hydrolase [Anaerovorax odorimutans]MCQ4637591.1 serine hydrolase [Anaerovorax odorimutans]
MNTREHETMKVRGSADVSYLEKTVDQMVWEFMEEEEIPGLTLAIVQAPYIPRVVGYGVSDAQQRRLASANTMWPAGPISQAFAAVATMQLYEDGTLQLEDTVGKWIPEAPGSWKAITVLQLLRHASGLADYRQDNAFCPFCKWTFGELMELTADMPLRFTPGMDVEQSATNFLLLTEIIERACGMSYHDFVTERQIRYLGLPRTGFAENLDKFNYEDVSLTGNVHQKFKADGLYIDPTESAASYGPEGQPVARVESSALRGFSDLWASAQDISFWDISLAGSVLIHSQESRDLIYKPWQLPDGREVPAVAGWQFYKHRGLMDIKGSVPGFSSFLSRFTHAEELVCVTLLANKEGVDFTNLGRRIAGAFGDLLSTNYDDNKLYLLEGQLSAADTVTRLEEALTERNIPVFAKFDHQRNAKAVGQELRPTTVLVFGSPEVGTGLMQADQSISLELPLRISVWEDEAGSTWLAFPWMQKLAAGYGLAENPVIPKMQKLLETLVRRAGSVY